jgi:hypothetical protein
VLIGVALFFSFAQRARSKYRKRNDALARAYALLADGQNKQARELFAKAVDVTPKMAYQLIKVRLVVSL